jgi:Icc-related predicted phosphoesterase
LATWFFATDLHGVQDRYDKLYSCSFRERPAAVLMGGDLLPRSFDGERGDFIRDHLVPGFERLRHEMGTNYPEVFIILGNDDPKAEEPAFVQAAEQGIWRYIHCRKCSMASFDLYGYAFVPPTPFLLKDWERYDVSRYVAPGSVSPEEGIRSVEVEQHWVKWGTIAKDLEELTPRTSLERSIFLFHSPPHETCLDRAPLDGKTYEHVPMDVHVGSIAIRRFIEARQPLLTLHGHVHESSRLTGTWKIQLGRTTCINGAHDGPELALVRFDPTCPALATRELL